MKHKCMAFIMHGCQRNPDKTNPLICCQSCSKKSQCYFACMNSPRKCGMSKESAEVEEPERKKRRKTRPVKALDPETGEVVVVYDSVQEASVAIKTSDTPIYAAIRHGKILHGYKWQYVHEKFKG